MPTQFGSPLSYSLWPINGTPFSYWIDQTLDGGGCSTPMLPAMPINLKVNIDGGTASSIPTDLIPCGGSYS